MRHDHGLSIDQIAKRLNVTRTTAGRAHMLWHKKHPDWSGQIAWQVLCQRAGKLPPASRQTICQLYQAGHRERDIDRELGIDKVQVHAVLRALQGRSKG